MKKVQRGIRGLGRHRKPSLAAERGGPSISFGPKGAQARCDKGKRLVCFDVGMN